MKNKYAVTGMCSLLAGRLSSIWSIFPKVNVASPHGVKMLYKKDKPMTAIIFDLDGTLIDSVGDIHAALNQMLTQAGHDPLVIETVTSFVGKGSSNLVKRVIDHVGMPDDAASHAHYVSEFLDIYTSAPAKFTTVFDHVHEVLTEFHSSGIALGLCTNKPEAPTNVVLDAFGLTTFFGSIVSGDRLPSRKPDPAMLHLVMQELGVERCLFVGDSEVDVATAKAAGMPIALFTSGYRQTPVAALAPDFAFDHFQDLPAIAAPFLRQKHDC
jgi:phosphoglycolate phosphatase